MSLYKRLVLLLWSAMPAAATLLLLVACMVPKHIDALGSVMPQLPMIAIFYWGLNHARAMPLWFVFALGLIADAANGQPMGLTALLNVFFLALIHAQHKYIHKEGFAIKWVYFALLLGVVSLLHYLLLWLFYGRAYGFGPAFVQWLLTLCCYPLLHQCFELLYHQIARRRWMLMHDR